MLGAAGKSAQIPLYIWLPDAMEGPTPVSALIHAATMVTAGVYMVARCHLCSTARRGADRGRLIGAATAIFAASIGMVQHDIKRVLAYSTISQLGYMFLACGVGAYSAGIFHLLTHAFFKALLFLAAGSVIHALSGEQDMRKMGGLRTRTPITFWTMSAGVFAIAGIPPFAGLCLRRRLAGGVRPRAGRIRPGSGSLRRGRPREDRRSSHRRRRRSPLHSVRRAMTLAVEEMARLERRRTPRPLRVSAAGSRLPRGDVAAAITIRPTSSAPRC